VQLDNFEAAIIAVKSNVNVKGKFIRRILVKNL